MNDADIVDVIARAEIIAASGMTAVVFAVSGDGSVYYVGSDGNVRLAMRMTRDRIEYGSPYLVHKWYVETARVCTEFTSELSFREMCIAARSSLIDSCPATAARALPPGPIVIDGVFEGDQ